jgi:hypothetical protein
MQSATQTTFANYTGRKLYGVFVPAAGWCMTTNKKDALALAKEKSGSVRVMPYPSGSGAWDRPTFHVCSDLLADFAA